MTATVTVLHPGAMGSRIGGELAAAGCDVRWLAAGRSDQTRALADRERLVAAGTPQQALDGADLVISVCPPQAAVDMARMVADAGFAETYVDANPLSPAALDEVARLVTGAGATFVDAGIVGPPPAPGSRTHLYLSGPAAAVAAVAEMCAPTAISPIDLGTRAGAASAAKQAYAFFNKGRLALAQVAAELAAAYGVGHVLAGEADRPGADPLADPPALRQRLDEVAWRWAPEFEEIAATLTAADLDPAPARSIAAVYSRLGQRRT